MLINNNNVRHLDHSIPYDTKIYHTILCTHKCVLLNKILY